MPQRLRAYYGLPYADHGRTRTGLDCWGLPVLVYRELFGIELPKYGGASVNAAELRELAALSRGETVDTWSKVTDPRPYDLVWFRNLQSEDATHVGIVLRPGLMLHAYRDAASVVPEDYTPRSWSTFLIGVYRHRELLERQREA